ncbi:uncharacterized protein [Argopecten irradians]|uniref:uncharacterized protein n=1 Tax=Argopecten irradians TaxID=31199 RepID=UPI0037105179
MAYGGLPALKWSNTTYSIQEVIENQNFQLPMLVKVEEGILSETDSETFSTDDLIKFDCIKSIPKVVACCVDWMGQCTTPDTLREDAHGYVERNMDLTIPLRYKGMVKNYHPEAGIKIYRNIKEVIKDRPRYVMTTNGMVTRGKVTVPNNSTLEVLGCIPGKGVIFQLLDKYGTNLEMNIDDKCRLRLLPDDTEYTLQDAIHRFGFPQYVTFVRDRSLNIETSNVQEAAEHSKIFEGTVKIKRIVELKTIIGHYKPPEMTSIDTTRRCQRTLVIIPLESPTAKEIEVRVALNNEDDDDYELIMARNFSNTNAVNEENIDGTIYMDFLKTPKTAFVEYENIADVPPRTPRRSALDFR